MKRQYNEVAMGLVVSMLLLLSACASMPPPNAELTWAQSAVNEAKEAGSERYAPLEIRNARKKLQSARTAMEQEDYERAKRFAEQAQVDAQLAEQKALSSKGQKSVKEIQDNIRLLRKEMGLPES